MDEIVKDILTQPETNSLSSVIDKASSEILKEEPKEEKKVTEKKEDSKPSDDLTEEEITLAKNMMKALKDPDQADGVIAYLAKQGGYTKAEVKELEKKIESGVDSKEIKDEIVELLSEQFGDEFAKKLAPAIKKAIETGVEEKTKGIKQTFEQAEVQKYEKEANTVLSGITSKFYGPDATELPKEISSAMDKLMDRYKPSSDQSLENYLTDIYSMATAKAGGNLKPFDSSKQQRIDKNKNDIPGNMSSRSRSPVPDSGKDSTISKNLDDAIAKAKAAIEKENE